jgi:hypothetical protein
LEAKVKQLLIAVFLVFCSAHVAQAEEVEKVISMTAHRGMSVDGVYWENTVYRNIFRTPAAFRTEFCRINPKRMKECSEKEFRRLPAGKNWNFPAIPEVSAINSTNETVTAKTIYTKDPRGFYRATDVVLETLPLVPAPERFISITARQKLTARSVYENNGLYQSLFALPAFISEVCRINPGKANCGKGAGTPLLLKKGDTVNFPAIRKVYLINSTEPILYGHTIYTKDPRGFYRDTERTVAN